MRFAKKAVSLLLVFLVALSVVCLPVSADTEVRYGKSILLQMDNADALAFAYDQLVDGCAVAAQGVDFRHDTYCISKEETAMVYDLFCRDYPEYFWLNGGYSSAVLGTQTVELYPKYNMSGDALLEAQANFNAQTEHLIQGLAGKTDYEKALILHDRLAEVVTYEQSGHHQTAYGALVGSKAVCAGYSRAYQHLLQSVGITAWYVSGASADPVTGNLVGHAWNLVKIDGEWYYTDVTWDDQGDTVYYAYFNVTSAQIDAKHFADECAQYLPVATATAANYFVKNGRVATTFDATQLAQWMLDDHRTVQFYAECDTHAYLEGFFENFAQVIAEMGSQNPVSYGCSASFLDSTLIITITLEESTHTYQGVCDGECDVCGLTREAADHQYQNACDSACDVCGEERAVGDHVYSGEQDADCNECGHIREITPTYIMGDLNGDNEVSDADAVHLLMHTFFADFYPVNQDCDFNGDTVVSDADATYLLMHTFFPDFYPIG